MSGIVEPIMGESKKRVVSTASSVRFMRSSPACIRDCGTHIATVLNAGSATSLIRTLATTTMALVSAAAVDYGRG